MKRATLIVANLALLLGGVGQTRADTITPGLSFTGGVFVPSEPGDILGYEFAATQSITVNSLAYFDSGSGFSAGHAVGLWDSNGNLLASTTVTNADVLIGQFRYDPIAVVTLTAGHDYFVGGVSGNDPYYYGTTATTASGITYVQDAFQFNSNLVFPNLTDGYNDAYFGASFGIGANSAVAAPEPATLTLLGIGLACLAGYGWRRRKLAAA